MDLRILDIANLERELAYYKRECNDLGARLLRLQEEQSLAFREARRSRTVAKLIREAHSVADSCVSPEEIGEALLQMIVDNVICDRAAILNRGKSKEEADIFRITHAVGFGADLFNNKIFIPSAPSFFLTTSRTALDSPATEIMKILQLPYVLWAYDRASGNALVLGNKSEANVSRPFEAGDQELVEGALSVYVDIMIRKKTEIELRLAKAAAEESSALRARFIATLSHELRTPLNAIIGFSDMMMPESNYNTTEAQIFEYARQINTSGRILLELINDILDYSSITRVSPNLNLSWIKSSVALHSCIRDLGSLVIQKGVVMKFDKTDPEIEIYVDRLRFRQILNNIIGNAIKFTGSGGSVSVAADIGPSGGARIIVCDTGVGMKPEDIPRALEPFQQIDGGHTRSFPGTGLGLPIAKGLVEAHGGSLQITSTPGEGTVVTVDLPASITRTREVKIASVR